MGFVNVNGLTKVFHPLQLDGRAWPPLRRRQPVCALRDCELSVREGEILGLLGTNGAGKTTVLKILATMLPPTTGTATVAGCDVVRQANRVKALVGWASGDERSFHWRLTGRQNLEFFAAFHGIPPWAIAPRLRQLETLLGLEAMDRRFGTYSTGMRHRLAIARALLHDPAVLLLDEPTRSLDPLATARLHRFLKDTLVTRSGKTLLFATHNLQEAETLCDRIAVLHEGRVVAVGTIEELRRASGSEARTRLAGIFERLATGRESA